MKKIIAMLIMTGLSIAIVSNQPALPSNVVVNPFVGTMTATSFSGSAAGLTVFPSSVVTNNYSTNITLNGIYDKKFCAAGMYVTANVSTFTPTGAFTTYNVGIIVGECIDGATCSTDGTILIDYGGYYNLSFCGSIDKQTDSDDIEIGGSLNGADPDPRATVKMDGTMAGFNGFGKTGSLRLPDNAVLCVKIKNLTSASRTVTIRDYNLSVYRLAN